MSADNGNGHAPEPAEEVVDHAAEADHFEGHAAKLLRDLPSQVEDAEGPLMIAEAQAAATIALSHRTAHQTEQMRLLGDEANRVLMGIEGAVG